MSTLLCNLPMHFVTHAPVSSAPMPPPPMCCVANTLKCLNGRSRHVCRGTVPERSKNNVHHTINHVREQDSMTILTPWWLRLTLESAESRQCSSSSDPTLSRVPKTHDAEVHKGLPALHLAASWCAVSAPPQRAIAA